MRTIISAALMLLSTSALATKPHSPDANVEPTAVGVGVGVADARSTSVSGAHVFSSNTNTNTNTLSQIAEGGAGGAASSNSSAHAEGGAGGAGGEGGSADVKINSTYRAVRNAPSVALGSVFPTASCQGGFGIGGSGVNGSGLLNFSFTKKECETFLLAQHFMSIGMPDISCEILKTTKSFKRALKQYPELRTLVDCSPPVNVTTEAAKSTTSVAPPDMSQYVTKEELDRVFRKTVSK